MRTYLLYVLSLGLLVGSAACAGGDSDPATTAPANNTANNTTNDCFDRDGDGFGRGASCLGEDCDDTNRAVNVDCGGCTDGDGDGYGTGTGCRGADCDDADRAVNPGAIEVPGNGKDDDCVGGDLDCVDNDGDGFGTGTQCRGADCDDNDRNVRPGAREICGNGKDDDCEGGDAMCADDCVDMDGDGFGTGDGCLGPDCDDGNNAINPNSQEVCNGKDDNCDNNVDECAEMTQSCDPARRVCLSAIGGPCTRDSECVSDLVCEGNSCLGTAGVACTSNGDCSSDFVCENNVCGADPNRDVCGDLDCGAADMFCLEDRGECVQCLDTFDCPNVELCAGFVCQGNLDQMDVIFTDDDSAVLKMAQTVASCFHNSAINPREDGFRLCGIFDASSLALSLEKDTVRDFVCDDAAEADFEGVDGTLDDAENAFGCGFTDLDDVEWDTPIAPGEDWITCIWTIEDFLDDTTVIADCSTFPTDR